jgi:hypothetical protein
VGNIYLFIYLFTGDLGSTVMKGAEYLGRYKRVLLWRRGLMLSLSVRR